MDDDGHVLEYTAGALEFFKCGPVFIQAIKNFRVNWIRSTQALKVFVALRLYGKLPGVAAIKFAKLPDDVFYFGRFARALEQAAAHNFRTISKASSVPTGFHTDSRKALFERLKRMLPRRASGLQFGFRQGCQKNRIRYRLYGFGKGLNKADVAVERTGWKLRERFSSIQRPISLEPAIA